MERHRGRKKEGGGGAEDRQTERETGTAWKIHPDRDSQTVRQVELTLAEQ